MTYFDTLAPAEAPEAPGPEPMDPYPPNPTPPLPEPDPIPPLPDPSPLPPIPEPQPAPPQPGPDPFPPLKPVTKLPDGTDPLMVAAPAVTHHSRSASDRLARRHAHGAGRHRRPGHLRRLVRVDH